MDRITLNQLCNLLNFYKATYGDQELITIGTSSELEYFFVVGDENSKFVKLPVPQYKDSYSERLNQYLNTEF